MPCCSGGCETGVCTSGDGNSADSDKNMQKTSRLLSFFRKNYFFAYLFDKKDENILQFPFFSLSLSLEKNFENDMKQMFNYAYSFYFYFTKK